MSSVFLQYIEDCIEFIAGHRDVNGKVLGLFDTVPSPISLARYDVKIVNSLACQTLEKQMAYTDRQADLAKKLVNKYRKQLKQLPIPVIVPENFDSFRMPIRLVDRTKRAYIEDQKLILKFPYDNELIKAVKIQAKEGEGAANFLMEKKIWQFSITESSINWICTISEKYDIELDRSITDLYIKIIECEHEPYRIELVDTGSGYDILNANSNLKQYIQNHLGGFEYSNLLKLIDNSELLGYSVAPVLMEKFKIEYQIQLNPTAMICTENRHFTFQTALLDDIVEYATLTDRLPVYVYATGLPKQNTDKVKYLKHQSVDTHIKCLVSESSIMVGTRKQSWLSQAEKIFYIG